MPRQRALVAPPLELRLAICRVSSLPPRQGGLGDLSTRARQPAPGHPSSGGKPGRVVAQHGRHGRCGAAAAGGRGGPDGRVRCRAPARGPLSGGARLGSESREVQTGVLHYQQIQPCPLSWRQSTMVQRCLSRQVGAGDVSRVSEGKVQPTRGHVQPARRRPSIAPRHAVKRQPALIDHSSPKVSPKSYGKRVQSEQSKSRTWPPNTKRSPLSNRTTFGSRPP